MGRPQLGLPRLRFINLDPVWIVLRQTQVGDSNDDGVLADIKKPRSGPGPASLSGWECLHKSGGGGAVFLDGDLLFSAEPIFLVVAVLAASFLVEL